MVDTTNVRLDTNQLGHIQRSLGKIAEAIDRNTAAIKEASITANTINVFKDPDGSS